jgi:predicted RNA-binding protein YlxR (DUF448 family)
VVCRRRQGKRALVRVARTSDGMVSVDLTGKGPGRGAYLCPRRACWADPGMPRRLGHALKAPLSDDDRALLAAFAAGLPEEDDHG